MAQRKKKNGIDGIVVVVYIDGRRRASDDPPRIAGGGRKQQRAGGVRRRFGARRFAITLVCHSAERRFGVEREPVVTYARARVCAARRSTTRALPVVAGQRSACVEQCDRECRARGQKKQGIDDLFSTLCPRVSSKSFRPGSLPSRERDAPIEKHNSTFVP
jgi:hypothetical protein